ncbi:MAG: hypothetical protein ACFCU1_06990 [Sumerlaeia bacterium]
MRASEPKAPKALTPRTLEQPATEAESTSTGQPVHPANCDCCSVPTGEGISAYRAKLYRQLEKKP